MDVAMQIATELSIHLEQVNAIINLLDEGATIPFIARYRKEKHGSLDEVTIESIRNRANQLKELDTRKQSILKSLTEREILTPELESAINLALNISTLEDIYLPYRPKKRTRATIAREKGLEPLAHVLFEQKDSVIPEQVALAYISPNSGIGSTDQALAGARDIIAEIAAEDSAARSAMRSFFFRNATLTSKVIKGKNEETSKFSDYFDWKESVSSIAGHRVLAMLRGEKEGILSLHALPESDVATNLYKKKFIQNSSPSSHQVEKALEDSYKRLLAPSMETELLNTLRQKSEEEAINVFSKNLRQLLLAAPLGQKRVLAVDPGFRTGCKVVSLNKQGDLLHYDLIHIMSEDQQKKSSTKIKALCSEYSIEAIAIGNGTASRETETVIRSLQLPIPIVIVSESGASVYSASEVARKEFPDLDLTVRGAISIGRRLMDPLAELVKIDPKSIGVGQYQHDVDQTKLKQSLDDVIVSCVNSVGVDLNTASAELLSYVSGLGPSLAKSIIDYREKNGSFKNRKELLSVTRLGPKAFEQSAGFLRIQKGNNPLDASAVHPESYSIVTAIAKDLGCSIEQLLKKNDLRHTVILEKYITDKIGLPTLTDIMSELEKPGRDPRKSFESFSFNEKITSITDLEKGMLLPGIVTNITNFGAFVDIGVHQDGLIHISQIADHFISDPHTALSLQQKVKVIVLDVDVSRKRISLSMRVNADHADSPPKKKEVTSVNSKRNENKESTTNNYLPFKHLKLTNK